MCHARAHPTDSLQLVPKAFGRLLVDNEDSYQEPGGKKRKLFPLLHLCRATMKSTRKHNKPENTTKKKNTQKQENTKTRTYKKNKKTQQTRTYKKQENITNKKKIQQTSKHNK